MERLEIFRQLNCVCGVVLLTNGFTAFKHTLALLARSSTAMTAKMAMENLRFIPVSIVREAIVQLAKNRITVKIVTELLTIFLPGLCGAWLLLCERL